MASRLWATSDTLAERLGYGPEDRLLIVAHPVLDGEELRAYDAANAEIRAHDALCLPIA